MTRAGRVATAAAVLAWIGAAGLSAGLAARHDALVALPGEGWVLPAGLIAAHAALLLLWGPPVAALAREAPVSRGVMLALPPLGLLVGAWLPLAQAPVDLPGPVGPARAGPDVILLTLDTFRADHLGAIGGGDLTPALDAFAATATLYTQAVSTAPLTAPAHASMLTGLDVRGHGLLGNGRAVAADTIVPELAARGWRAGAFVSSRVLDREAGLHRGFHHYDDRFGWAERLSWVPGLGARGPVARDGGETVDRALSWLLSDDRPALLWVHLYDAHLPYEPPDAFRPDPAALAAARAADRAERRESAGDGDALRGLEGAHVREGKLRYAAEIRYVDHLAGRLLAAIPDDAVVIVVADHGESLDEHGYWFNHGARLHEPALHVPMIVRWPGRAPAVVSELVSVQDVAGIVLAATEGAELAPHRDEVVAWTSGQQNRRGLGPKAKKMPSAAIRVGGGKVVAHEGGAPVWHDLTVDPGELAPAAVPGALGGLAARVEGLVAEPVEAAEGAERERLEALGYVE